MPCAGTYDLNHKEGFNQLFFKLEKQLQQYDI